MGQVSVTLNGRTYRLECDDGEEKHLLSLAEILGQEVDDLTGRFGQVGDDRLLVMAALMIADRMSDIQRKLDAANEMLDKFRSENATVDDRVRSAQAEVADKIGSAAARIEELSAALADQPPPARD